MATGFVIGALAGFVFGVLFGMVLGDDVSRNR